jgi:superfamily II helicase
MLFKFVNGMQHTMRIDSCRKCGKEIIKRIIELKLLQQGFYTHLKRVLQYEKYIEQFFNAQKINLEELYELKEIITKLFTDNQPKFVEKQTV